ncbi:MAG: nucleoside recognition domain-containing protein [Verrucomicrobiota bacterium]
MPSPTPAPDTIQTKRSVVVLGLESVGKSSLLSALSGKRVESSALIGSTLHCQSYVDSSVEWIDTPGIVTDSDTATMQETVAALETNDTVLLVLRAHRAVEEFAQLVPLLRSQRIVVALTHRDRLIAPDSDGQARAEIWSKRLGIPVLLLDGRKLEPLELADLRTAIGFAAPLKTRRPRALPNFQVIPVGWVRMTLEKALGFPPVSLLLLFGPAWIAVTQANRFADSFYDPLLRQLEVPLAWLNNLPAPLAAMLAGDYGVVAMFPFLLLYALPTIVIFSGLLAIYKNTGLIDRLSYGLHPLLEPFGLGGRDLVRVVMGFGCNVPAIVATRSCSSCSRGACVSAISFGSVCSYQLPATLAVFAATGYVWLGPVYLAVLAVTTLLYLRLTRPRHPLGSKSQLLHPALGNLHRPDLRNMGQEIKQSLSDFFQTALPIFVGICFFAGLLQWSGALAVLTDAAGPIMALFRLPPEAALAVVLGSVRKDGLAIGLLDAEWNALKVPMEAPLQILTAVYLAGVLLPCLVTLVTIVREMRPRFALKMISRQISFAALFSLLIAWGGHFLLALFYN